MREFRYIDGVTTLKLDRDRCNGCRACMDVCPHGVFSVAEDRRMRIADLDGCMECGACETNCPTGAISLKPGVGCAEAIVHSWIYGGEPTCGCGGDTDAAVSSCCGDAGTGADEGSSCCGGTGAGKSGGCC